MEEGTERDFEQNTFSEHWGWFSTLYHLSKSSILTITGDKNITDLNLIFVFNYLAFEHDKNLEEQKAIKAQQQTYKIR
jgi:hypothetical protein